MDNDLNKTKNNFIYEIIRKDIENNKNDGKVVTRFPPEPNGYLHIGHAKSIVLNFSTAEDFNGVCHLRFDDTNPAKEDVEFTNSIQEDIKWLGYDWGDKIFNASDYFDRLYELAVKLIKDGKAYVCFLTAEETRDYRGTLTSPGKESPYRNTSVAENLDFFEKMKNGEFGDGHSVLRAKIDMASGNMVMRDPVLYRIKKATHHKTGDKWCIYPMYDFTHPLSDSTEGITHSLCTLEFENNRELYDWVIEATEVKNKPQQIEFARLNLTYTVMSKRKLLQLVEGKYVKGWDDPRMPTISGLRRRGYTAESIKDFCGRIGVAKSNSVVDFALLEHCLREDLNQRANRVMAVLNPIKLTITNYSENKTEELEAKNNPEDETAGVRSLPFSRELFIEKDDFMENPPKKFFRLALGKEVRLKYAYYVKCEEVVKDANGEITEILCTYDPATKGGWSEDGRKVKGTIHWVDAKTAVDARVQLYDNLFVKENPDECDEGKDFLSNLNPDSVKLVDGVKLEKSLSDAKESAFYQFERLGYFILDSDSAKEGLKIFNRSVSLRDSWAKIQKAMNK